jgi:CHAT domain-containing protein
LGPEIQSRSLSDILGLGILIPQQLMERIQRNSSTWKSFEDESSLARSLATASETERFKARIKLENHQKAMRKDSVLAELLTLREGVPVDLNELLASNLEVKTVRDYSTIFVDWIATGTIISMYVVRDEEQPVLIELSTTLVSIQRWVMERLNNETASAIDAPREATLSGILEEDEADEGPLRDLDALIAPLYSLSRPNDLLVLCPTGVLHALPLHALRFGPPDDNQILIQRNLVVYCSNLTSFAQCCRRAETSPVTDLRKHFLAVYAQDSGRAQDQQVLYNDTERRQIYTSTEQLATELNGEALCGHRVTAASFRNSLESADVVHVFGHYDYSYEVVAEQSLLVGRGEEGNNGKFFSHRRYPPVYTYVSGTDISIDSRAASVALKDLFDFRIKTTHVTLLACATAFQEFQAGDEPLGLVIAFLSAGATSVLGTLWPVQSSAARLFSERFYLHLLRSATNASVHGPYNVAYAVKEAVLDVRQVWDYRQPYHWAPFVLHGAWFYNETL